MPIVCHCRISISHRVSLGIAKVTASVVDISDFWLSHARQEALAFAKRGLLACKAPAKQSAAIKREFCIRTKAYECRVQTEANYPDHPGDARSLGSKPGIAAVKNPHGSRPAEFQPSQVEGPLGDGVGENWGDMPFGGPPPVGRAGLPSVAHSCQGQAYHLAMPLPGLSA